MMPKDLKELLRAFNDHTVKYLIVGGYAFGVHAEPRATKDLNRFIRPDEENSQALFRALTHTGLLLRVSVWLIFWTAPCSRSATLLPEWTFCSTSTVSVSIKPGKIESRALSTAKSQPSLYPEMTSSKINSQVEESRTFSTSRNCELRFAKIHRTSVP
jgi:hypothetical protein